MPMSCEGNHCPTGEGRDGTGPSSRYEGRVFQPSHCAQEKRWVTTNLGSAHLELGLSRKLTSFQDHAEPHFRMYRAYYEHIIFFIIRHIHNHTSIISSEMQVELKKNTAFT